MFNGTVPWSHFFDRHVPSFTLRERSQLPHYNRDKIACGLFFPSIKITFIQLPPKRDILVIVTSKLQLSPNLIQFPS